MFIVILRCNFIHNGTHGTVFAEEHEIIFFVIVQFTLQTIIFSF